MNIADYLATLRLALSKHLPARLVDDRLAEIRTHLQMAQSEGDDKFAIAELGDPKLLARELVRQHSRVDVTSGWRLVRWVGPLSAIATIYFFGGMSFFMYDAIALNQYFLNWQPLILWIPALLFAGVVLRSRRWLFQFMIPWMVFASIAIMGCASIGPVLTYKPFTADQRSEAESSLGEWRKNHAKSVSLAAQWSAGILPNKGIKWMSTPTKFYMPFVPVGIETSQNSYYLVDQPARPLREESWRRFGQAFQSQVAKEVEPKFSFAKPEWPSLTSLKKTMRPRFSSLCLLPFLFYIIENGVLLLVMSLVDRNRQDRWRRRLRA